MKIPDGWPVPTTIPAIGPAYNRESVAEIFGVTPQTVTAWKDRGAVSPDGARVTIGHVAIGLRVWYPLCAVVAHVEAMKRPGTTIAPPSDAPVETRKTPREVVDRLRRRGFAV